MHYWKKHVHNGEITCIGLQQNFQAEEGGEANGTVCKFTNVLLYLDNSQWENQARNLPMYFLTWTI